MCAFKQVIYAVTYTHTGLVLMSLFNVIANSHGFLYVEKSGMVVRVLLTAAIYQKVRKFLYCCLKQYLLL